MSGSKDYDQAADMLKYISDVYGNSYRANSVSITPGNTYTYAGGPYTIVGAGGGGSSSYTTSPKTFTTVDGQVYYDGVKYVPEEMKLNKKNLSDQELRQIADYCILTHKPGETLLIRVGSDTDSAAMNQLGMSLNANSIPYMFVGLVEPDCIEIGSPQDLHSLSDDQIAMLSRLAAVWESRPYLSFGNFLAMVFSTESLANIDDNVLITALEKAYGVDSD